MEINELIQKATELGAIACNMYLNANAKSAEQATEMLVSQVGKISKEPGIIYCHGEIDEPQKFDDRNYSALVEIKILAENLQSMAKVAIRYAPMSIEVLNHGKISLSAHEATAVLLDISLASQQFAFSYLKNQMTPEEAKAMQKQIEEQRQKAKQVLDKQKEKK